MNKSAPNILGLDIGARQIGVSVLCGEELVYYAIKSIRRESEKETLKRLQKVLIFLIDKYDIENVALERIVYVQQHGTTVKIVYEATRNFILTRNLRLFEYHPKLTRQIICQSNKSTKHNTALIISQRYSELVRYFNVRQFWQKRYFAQLFDAVAVGMVCAIELRETKLLSSKQKGKLNV